MKFVEVWTGNGEPEMSRQASVLCHSTFHKKNKINDFKVTRGGGGQMVSACDSGSNDSVRRRFESPRRWDIRAEVRNPSIGLGIRRPPKSLRCSVPPAGTSP